MSLRSTIIRDACGLRIEVLQVRLLIKSGPRAGDEVLLGDRPVVLGRDPGVEIPLPDEAASRRHARLTPSPEGWQLEDLGSRNGTRVGGARVERAVLADGSEFEVGATRMVLHIRRIEVGAPSAASSRPEGLRGESSAMRDLIELVQRVAPLDLSVLFVGESGTGKEKLARTLHGASEVRTGPYEVVDCTLLTGDHLRSELFGHTKGAFTGATDARKGAFERAHQGTLFLDEVGELPLDLQPQLLRILEAGEVRPLGGERPRQVSVRVVAATNRDLQAMAREGTFREDLYYRLSAIRVDVPPLRDRGKDALELAEHFLVRGVTLSAATRDAILAYPWPGNVRELRNCIQRAGALAKDRVVQPQDLGLRSRPSATLSAAPEAVLEPGPAGASLADAEEQAVRRVLDACDGNRTEAARQLGISRSTLYAKLKKYGLAS